MPSLLTEAVSAIRKDNAEIVVVRITALLEWKHWIVSLLLTQW